jgi:phosphotransferase system enzyme I (PtsP)
VLTLNNPQDVREEINNYLESVGLGGLVRAGN